MAKISTILDHIDSGYMALPVFQRGYVWTREQVRALFNSLYHRFPVGNLLIWATPSERADHRGDQALRPGVVQFLLDGQQRMTSIYGVVRGRPPAFFEGHAAAFTGLYFNLKSEEFAFHQPMKMRNDPLWIDVTSVMQQGHVAHDSLVGEATSYHGRLGNLLGIQEIDMYEQVLTEEDADIVVDIFDRINSKGTKLSKGDLALAKICANWPEARSTMNAHLAAWRNNGYTFDLDWLLRSVNTVLTGEAQFRFLHGKSSQEIQGALNGAVNQIDRCLNAIGGRLGLDHDRVLFGKYAFPVMARYLRGKGSRLPDAERDKLLFWYVQAAMWGRFSGSIETVINQDIDALSAEDEPLDNLIEQLRLWRGGLRIEPGHFGGFEFGSRFYPVLYMLTRTGDALDWGSDGVPLKSGLLGRMNTLEVHHIFPRAQLRKMGITRRREVNALANFCFLTKDSNLEILDRLPEEYFMEVERNHPGALESQWIPQDRNLWKIENYHEFLAARRELLADAANNLMANLLHGDARWVGGATRDAIPETLDTETPAVEIDEDEEIEAINARVTSKGLAQGVVDYDVSDPETGQQKAVLDIAWPDGLQAELSQPIAVLLNESNEALAVASQAGFRCFTNRVEFEKYVQMEILPEQE